MEVIEVFHTRTMNFESNEIDYVVVQKSESTFKTRFVAHLKDGRTIIPKWGNTCSFNPTANEFMVKGDGPPGVYFMRFRVGQIRRE